MDECKPLNLNPYPALASGDPTHDSIIIWTRVTPTGRGLHSFTFQLNLSRFLSLTPPTDTEHPTKRAYVEPKSGRV